MILKIKNRRKIFKIFKIFKITDFLFFQNKNRQNQKMTVFKLSSNNKDIKCLSFYILHIKLQVAVSFLMTYL